MPEITLTSYSTGTFVAPWARRSIGSEAISELPIARPLLSRCNFTTNEKSPSTLGKKATGGKLKQASFVGVEYVCSLIASRRSPKLRKALDLGRVKMLQSTLHAIHFKHI
jgi:hypothetical protein